MFDEHEGETTLIPLFDRLAAGDTSAAEEIIEHSMERLRLLAHKRLLSFPLVKEKNQTDDVVQGAALRLYRALKAVAPVSVGHLMRLASVQIRRELLDLMRQVRAEQERRAEMRLLPAHELRKLIRPGPAHDTPSGEQVFDAADPHDESRERKRQQLEEIDEQVENLPEEQRAVFEQVFYQGLTHGDIARILGISESTVKRRWYDAQDTLHRLLSDDA